MGKLNSFSSDPAWYATDRGRLACVSCLVSSSMVVNYLDSRATSVRPIEADAIPRINSNAVNRFIVFRRSWPRPATPL